MSKAVSTFSSSLDLKELLKKFSLPADILETTGLVESELKAIYEEHLKRFDSLENAGSAVAEQLRQSAEVHSLKYRVKNPEHLIEKIIRKRVDAPERIIGFDNYKEEITDLIGIRALHIFKESWGAIHDYVTSTWDIAEKPTANVRLGDSPEVNKAYTDRDCKVNIHDAGYRSVHYLIRTQPTKTIFTVELQVRTLFEEGWGEIDHRIRYPYDLDNPVLVPLLLILNRLAGNADEVASYIVLLQTEWQNIQSQMQDVQEQHCRALEERDRQVTQLQARIESLEIDADAKKEIKDSIESINAFDISSADPSGSDKVNSDHPSFSTRDAILKNYASLLSSRPVIPSSSLMAAMAAASPALSSAMFPIRLDAAAILGLETAAISPLLTPNVNLYKSNILGALGGLGASAIALESIKAAQGATKSLSTKKLLQDALSGFDSVEALWKTMPELGIVAIPAPVQPETAKKKPAKNISKKQTDVED